MLVGHTEFGDIRTVETHFLCGNVKRTHVWAEQTEKKELKMFLTEQEAL